MAAFFLALRSCRAALARGGAIGVPQSAGGALRGGEGRNARASAVDGVRAYSGPALISSCCSPRSSSFSSAPAAGSERAR